MNRVKNCQGEHEKSSLSGKHVTGVSMQPNSALEQLTATAGSGTGETGCEAQRSKSCSPKRRKRPWRAVALDNDETTGSWGRASLLYRLWVNVVGRKPSVDDFVDHYLAYGGARPGLANLLRELDQLKQMCSMLLRALQAFRGVQF